MNSDFKTLEDLYKRLKPALYSKRIELKRMGLEYIKEEDIFNYLVSDSWANKKDLSISELTNDILYLDKNLISNYCLKVFEKEDRDIIKEEENLL